MQLALLYLRLSHAAVPLCMLVRMQALRNMRLGEQGEEHGGHRALGTVVGCTRIL